MSGEPKTIVIVMYQYSVIVKGIERKLTDGGYRVAILAGEFDKISEMAGTTSLFIVYLPSGIAEDTTDFNHLMYIHDAIAENGRTMLLIGEKKDRPGLMEKDFRLEHFPWLDRPVKMDALALAVEAAIEIGRRKKILIVDDDPAYAKMAREWLRGEYQTFSVTGGMNAITFLLKTPVDLILLDYEMPVVDGPQVLQMLRQEPATRDIPVVFLTGVSTREGVERVMALKPEGYVLKSATKDKLLGYLRKRFEESESGDG